MSLLILLWLLSLQVLIPCVKGDAELKIHFVSYDTKGRDDDNDRCDPWPFKRDCDPELEFCIDHHNSQNENVNSASSSCPLGYFKTNGHYDDKDKVYFGSSIKGIPNPLTIPMTSYPGGFKFKAHTEDADVDSDDDIDDISKVFTQTRDLSSATFSYIQYTVLGKRSRKPTELVMKVGVYCTTNYYGLPCDVYCVGRDDHVGHYTCDQNTGDKVCLPGWTGSDCAQSEDDCVGHSCMNGATCVDGHQRYTCNCAPGWSGAFCDDTTCPQCYNGAYCLGGFCQCTSGFTGLSCDQDIDECLQLPCGAGEICQNVYGGYRCSPDLCYNVHCQNGGTCNQGICTCLPNYTGTLCDVGICSIMPCHHGGTCINGHCTCPPGYSGTNCQSEIDDCAANPCPPPSTCVDIGLGYECLSGCEDIECMNEGICEDGTCQCPDGIFGTYCDVDSCSIIECLHGGTCDAGVCQCQPGYTCSRCQVDIDECSSQPCPDGATCVDGVNGYHCEHDVCYNQICHNGGSCNSDGQCDCPPNFAGNNCEFDLCLGWNCNNGGTCVAGTCICPDGYEGSLCESEIDECISNPCPDGWSCQDEVNSFTCVPHSCFDISCHNGGVCVDGTCICPQGFKGTFCLVDLCDTIVCHNNGTCSSGNCYCQAGYTGSRCTQDINECIPNPCPAGDQCVDKINGYDCITDPCGGITCYNNATCDDGQCLCLPGFIGSDCSVDVCYFLQCENEGSCHEGACVCAPGYSGSHCQDEIDECESSPCQPGAVCHDQINGYTCVMDECYNEDCSNNGLCVDGDCQCHPGFIGLKCEIDSCASLHCEHGGWCEAGLCVCPDGYQGVWCEEDIDDCAIQPCPPGTTCEDLVNAYQCLDGCEQVHCHNGGTCNGGDCTCPLGYIGAYCGEALCDHIMCQNGGSCIQPLGMCACAPGYTGTRCEENMNECDSNPCLDGHQCVDMVNSYVCLDGCENKVCHNGGSCQNGDCICDQGYTGVHCKVEVCSILRCLNGGSCEAGSCHCAAGYTGTVCETDEDDCASVPCKDGETCMDLVNGYACVSDPCHNIQCQNGGVCVESGVVGTCDCYNGYNGLYCENQICDSITCYNGGSCVGAQCDCAPGYSGDTCQTEIDECQSSPCPAGATCVDQVNGYVCDLDPCFSSPCHNGATCLKDSSGNAVCECLPGFVGTYCEVSLCDVVSCLNGGSCIEGDCECSLGYDGTYCEVDIDECASHPCKAGATCEDGIGTYTCHEDPCSGVLCKNGGSCVDGKCKCPPGIVGHFCGVDTCNLIPCFHGSCYQGSCDCDPGYTGRYCEEEVDECSSSPCDYGDTCQDLLNAYTCIPHPCKSVHCQNGGTCDDAGECLCRPGFEGQVCDVDICRYHVCLHGGTCYQGKCVCKLGYTGPHCEDKVDNVCASKPCPEDKICVNYDGGFACVDDYRCAEVICENGGTCYAGICICEEGYTGDQCQEKDKCHDKQCKNEGYCYHGDCVCKAGYYGDECEEKELSDEGNIGKNTEKDKDSSDGNQLVYLGIGFGLLLFIILAIFIAIVRRRRQNPHPVLGRLNSTDSRADILPRHSSTEDNIYDELRPGAPVPLKSNDYETYKRPTTSLHSYEGLSNPAYKNIPTPSSDYNTISSMTSKATYPSPSSDYNTVSSIASKATYPSPSSDYNTVSSMASTETYAKPAKKKINGVGEISGTFLQQPPQISNPVFAASSARRPSTESETYCKGGMRMSKTGKGSIYRPKGINDVGKTIAIKPSAAHGESKS